MFQVDNEKMQFINKKVQQVNSCWIDPSFTLPPEKNGLAILAYFIEKIDGDGVHIPMVLVYFEEYSSWTLYMSENNEMIDITQCIAWMPISALEPNTSEHISGSMYNFC